MPGDYVKGFPDPPNSPNEKFLFPATPQLWEDDLYKDLTRNGVPHNIALGVAYSVAKHEERKAVAEQYHKRTLEFWANIHTHPGGSGVDEGWGAGAVGDVFSIGSGLRVTDNDGDEIRTMGGGNFAVAATPSGETYVSISGSSPRLRKYNELGNQVWELPHEDSIHAIVVDKLGNVYTGVGNPTNSVRKITSEGTEIWEATGFPHTVVGIAVDKDLTVYAVSGSGRELKKIDSTGSEVWSSVIGSTGFARGLAIDGEGNSYVPTSSDNRVYKIDPEGDEVIEDNWPFSGYTDGPLEGVAVSENFVYTCGVGNTDHSIKKLDMSGLEVWSVSPHTQGAYQVQVDTSGNVYTAGEDGDVKKLAAEDGSVLWTYTGHGSTSVSDIALDMGTYAAYKE